MGNGSDLAMLVYDGNWTGDMSMKEMKRRNFRSFESFFNLLKFEVYYHLFVVPEQNMPLSIHVKDYKQVRVGQRR